MAIRFQSDIKNFKLLNKLRLKKFLGWMVEREGFKVGDLNFRFCDDEEILVANRTFLNHDYYTDVITFPLNEGEERIVADILISVDTVLFNSEKQATEFNTELHRVIFHSVLHLCGFGDKLPKEKKLMRANEDQYLKLYFE